MHFVLVLPTALVASLSMGFYTFLCPISSKICLVFGCRITTILAGLASSLGLLISSFAPNLYVLYLGYGLMLGFGGSMAYISSFQMIPLYFDKHCFLAIGLASVGSGAGLLIMSPIVQILLDHHGWRTAMMVLSGIHLVPCFLGCTITRKNDSSSNENNEYLTSLPLSKRVFKWLRSLDFSLIKNPKFMIISISTSITLLGNFTPYFHLVS